MELLDQQLLLAEYNEARTNARQQPQVDAHKDLKLNLCIDSDIDFASKATWQYAIQQWKKEGSMLTVTVVVRHLTMII